METTGERWKDIPRYEGYYQVSDRGRVKALARTIQRIDGKSQTFNERLMKITPTQDGYPQLALTKHCHAEHHCVHRLVLLAFVGPAPHDGYHACHEDGNPSNNHLKNLRWDTPKSNYADRERHGVFPDPTKPRNAKLSEDSVLAIRLDLRSNPVVAREYSVSRETIAMIRQYKTWQHVGGPHETPEIKTIRQTSQWQRHEWHIPLSEAFEPGQEHPVPSILHDNKEEWRDIPTFEGRYAVSSHGRVKSLTHTTTIQKSRAKSYIQSYPERILHINRATVYPTAVLKRGTKNVTFLIHRLVLQAFIGDPPLWHEACHRDGNRYNNHLSNLRWDTPKNNHADKLRQGTQAKGERIHNAKLTIKQAQAIRADPRSTAQVAREYGLTYPNVRAIRLRKTWKHV